MTHRIVARPSRGHGAARIERGDGVAASFLEDGANVSGGFAAGIAFPSNEADVVALLSDGASLLPVGAQSSLTGGATPRGEVVLSTRAMTEIGLPQQGSVRVGVGVPLVRLQQTLASSGAWFPPVPTFEGAFVGGAISTNASGPATFKYGSIRPWVLGITCVLANGSVLDLRRGDVVAAPNGFEVIHVGGDITHVPLPTYVMPDVSKLSAGYFARPGMDLIDLFIGAEGTLGIIVDATLRVMPLPRRAVAMIRCDSDPQAAAVTDALRAEAHFAWQNAGPLDVAAIEYMDARSLSCLPAEAFARGGVSRGSDRSSLLLAQIEVDIEQDAALSRLQDVLDRCGVRDSPAVAVAGDDRAARRLFELREAVPTAVNRRVAAAKARIDPEIEKTAADFVVPPERLADSLALYRRVLEERGLEYAIWGHVSDGNLHPNVIPRTLADVQSGREAILEMAKAVIRMGGAPLAEHGVGRSPVKQRLLQVLYGDAGIAEMRAVKRALDPHSKLSPGVLFPP